MTRTLGCPGLTVVVDQGPEALQHSSSAQKEVSTSSAAQQLVKKGSVTVIIWTNGAKAAGQDRAALHLQCTHGRECSSQRFSRLQTIRRGSNGMHVSCTPYHGYLGEQNKAAGKGENIMPTCGGEAQLEMQCFPACLLEGRLHALLAFGGTCVAPH